LGTPFEIMGEMTKIYNKEPKRIGEIRHLWKELRKYLFEETLRRRDVMREELIKKGDYWISQYSYAELIDNILPEIFNYFTKPYMFEEIKKSIQDEEIEMFDTINPEWEPYLIEAIPNYKIMKSIYEVVKSKL
jgi:hypothetical protein